MESTRQNKIARLLQKEISELLQLQSRQMTGILITVSDVKVSPDLGIAKVYLSIFPSEKGVEIVSAIKSNTKSIRYELGTKVRYQLRVIPELSFYLDETLNYLERIDELLGDPKGEKLEE